MITRFDGDLKSRGRKRRESACERAFKEEEKRQCGICDESPLKSWQRVKEWGGRGHLMEERGKSSL